MCVCAAGANSGMCVQDTWHVGILLARAYEHAIDLRTANEQSLHNIVMDTHFTLDHTAHVHGLAFWFDVAFDGSRWARAGGACAHTCLRSESVWLSTSPTEPLTHWYQVRCVLRRPLLVHRNGTCHARVKMVANQR